MRTSSGSQTRPWKSGDTSVFDDPILLAPAGGSKASLSLESQRESVMNGMRPKSGPLRLDPVSYKIYGNKCYAEMAGAVSPAER